MPRIIVSAGNHDRLFAPVSCILPDPATTPMQLVDQESRRSVPFQLSPDGTRLTWIVENLAVGQSREYVMSPGAAPLSAGDVSLKEVDNERVEVRIGGQLFTAYYFGKQYVRPFLYPVAGPYGPSVTRHFPMAEIEGESSDHVHHRSIWTAHGNVNGVDDWLEAKEHGSIVHQGFRALEQGPVFASIRAQNAWVSHAGAKVLNETRDITVYNEPSAGRLIDYEVCLTAADGDVTFGDTKEGGILSVRVATSMDVTSGGKIENSYRAINEKETWGKRAEWCDYSGPVEGKWAGIAVFDHPGNLRYPTYWHVRNYGLMTANMFGVATFTRDPNQRGDYTLPGGEILTFRYRIYIHAGDARQGHVAEKFHDFVNPPEVTVEE